MDIDENEYNTTASQFNRPQSLQLLSQGRSHDSIIIGKENISAYPQQSKPFYKLIPFCLWGSFTQPHILYYLVCTILQYFKFCSLQQGQIFGSSVQMFLIIVCLIFQINSRYSTYSQYTSFLPQENLGIYSVWNNVEHNWERINESELCVGQIIKVQKFHEGRDLLNPTNILPLMLASQKQSILIKTTRIDKKQQNIKVNLQESFKQLVKMENQTIKFDQKLFEAQIQYRFISNFGSTFQAVLKFSDENNVIINNKHIIPRGTPILTQQFVIGVILRHTQSFKLTSAFNSIMKSNKINKILNSYFIIVVIMNIFLLVSVLVINIILTTVTTSFDGNYGQYIYCLIINLAANLYNVVYIGMYILIYIQRTIDKKLVFSKYKLNFKNSLKSLDQLAQTDTLIMDDYFFLQKKYNQCTYFFNPKFKNQQIYSQQQQNNFIKYLNQQDLSNILNIANKSDLIKTYMNQQLITISKYFRLNQKQNKQKQFKNINKKIKIIQDQLIDDNTIQLKIQVKMPKYKDTIFQIKFRDKIQSSTRQEIKKIDEKLQILNQLQEGKDNDKLIFSIEIRNISENIKHFDFFAIFMSKQQLNSSSLKLVRSEAVLRKYNIVIMTSKSWKDINYWLICAKMRKAEDHFIQLQQKQQNDMHQIIRNHRKTLIQMQKKQPNRTKSITLFLNSSMIIYLSRKNMRRAIFKLSLHCKYIIFYNCSQYQKQISAVNLFKIFPDHIFLSNFICDYDILLYSNLSICQKNASSEMLTTAVIDSFPKLQTVIFAQAIKSIQIMYCLINSSIFKNQFLISSNIITFLLIYQGSSTQMGISYVSEIFFFYNFVFTIIPIVVMIIQRPKLYIDEDVRQYFNIRDMVVINIRTTIFGGFIAFIIYGLISQQFVANIFTSRLISSVIAGNLFLLYLDDSYNKKCQVISIILQIIFSIILIVLIQLLNANQFQFVSTGTNFDVNNQWFYLTTFLIVPIICTLSIFVFSAGRQIKIIENKRQIELKQWSERVQSGYTNEEQIYSDIVFKVQPRKGKQLSFNEQDNIID